MSDDEEGPAAGLESRIESAAAEAEAAETEAALDSVEETLEAIEADLEDADLPEPAEDDEEAEDEESPREALESALVEVRSTVEDARGPYAADVIDDAEDRADEVRDGDYTDDGIASLRETARAFLDAVESTLDVELPLADGAAPPAIAESIDTAAEAVEGADLDPDADAEAIEALLDAVDTLGDGIEAAETWSDLSVREQLERRGFYDVLDHHKDYPPEWSALKEHESRGNVEMVLLALEKFDSGFMEEHCIDALRRMADPAAMEAMQERAQKRDQDAIEVLGKIGSEAPVDMLLEYAENDGNPELQFVTLQALGEIGSHEATQTVADRLVHEDHRVRSQAARTLGLLGDTRAIDPLADVLETDEADVVRGSAAWALNQIGTERARSALEAYVDDRTYLVQVEAEKAAAP